MIVILVGLERFLPRAAGAARRGRAPGSPAAALLGLQARGVELVGHIPTGLPSLTLPDLSLAGGLWSAASASP